MQMMSPGTLSLDTLLGTIEQAVELSDTSNLRWGHDSGKVTAADLDALREEVREIMREYPENARSGAVRQSPHRCFLIR